MDPSPRYVHAVGVAVDGWGIKLDSPTLISSLRSIPTATPTPCDNKATKGPLSVGVRLAGQSETLFTGDLVRDLTGLEVLRRVGWWVEDG